VGVVNDCRSSLRYRPALRELQAGFDVDENDDVVAALGLDRRRLFSSRYKFRAFNDCEFPMVAEITRTQSTEAFFVAWEWRRCAN
jgi:hypothetical protein